VALPNEHPVIREKAEKIRVAEAATTAERAELLQLVRRELAAGRATKSSLARALGVSRQRVQKMLED
jgi:hypothetical protein